MADEKKPQTGRQATSSQPENPPVAPVENFDLGKVDKDRRIFGNGDTDREDSKE